MKRLGVIIVLITLFIFHYVIISPLCITTADLTKVDGLANGQHLIHVTRPKSSFNAYIIGVGDNAPSFGIQDNKNRAFKYLSTHSIDKEHVTIFYDAKGHNEDDKLTYHVYSVSVNGNNIMTMGEAKTYYYWGLLVLVLLDTIFIFFYRRDQRIARKAS